LTQAGAQVVAPADSKVLFAGPYHKTGQVLILEMADGYDLVLAGLNRLDVKGGDRVLEGEPLGTMPQDSRRAQLYFEVRHGEKAMSPAPWLEIGLRKAEKS
jgi:septal ring factor EnvC (AmiA/AmiB activator)